MPPKGRSYMNLLKKGIGVVGSTTIDKIIAENHSTTKPGGVTIYAGITYRRHGVPVFIVSNMAERDLEVLRILQAEGIRVFSSTSAFSTQFVNDIRGDNRPQELLQQAMPIETGQLQPILNRIACLHLGPLHPLDIEAGALSALQNSNLKICLDLQGYTRMVQNKKVYRSVSDQIIAGLALAHIIKANESEYKAILAFFRITLTELIHRFKIEECVITLGRKGGFVQNCRGEIFQYDAAVAKAPLDPTGAGDVFLAAYIVSRFADNQNIPGACVYAAEIAARQVEGNYIPGELLSLDAR